jgi:hypothetical protein
MRIKAKFLFFLCAIVVLSVFVLLTGNLAASGAKNDSQVSSFKYGIVGKHAHETDEYFTVEDSSVLHSGEYVRVNLCLNGGGFFYVIWQASNGDLIYLNPEMKSVSKGGAEEIFTTDWLKLDDDKGLETLYMLSSRERLEGLENLLGRFTCYLEKSGSSLNSELAAEISKLKMKTGSQASEPALKKRVEKPIEGGVVFRGPAENKDELHFEATGRELAFKEIRIIHKKP